MKKLLLPAALLLSSGVVMAGTASTTLNVSTTVGNVCTVATTPVNFGTYDSLNGNYASGSVTVSCNPGAYYTIALDSGLNGPFSRRLADGLGNTMGYSLYEPVYGNTWGDGWITVEGDVVAMTSTGTDTVTVNGFLYAGEMVPDGSYSDTVNVYVNY